MNRRDSFFIIEEIKIRHSYSMKRCHGHLETFHLNPPFDEEWYQEFEYELTDEEYDRLLKAFMEWSQTEEWKKMDCLDDDEYYLHRYVPDLCEKIRGVSEARALEIWGESIRPELSNMGIYVPDDIYEDYDRLVDGQDTDHH